MGERACDIEWEYLDRNAVRSLEAGALVSADAGGMPIYRVIRIDADRAWLRNVRDDSDRETPLSDFHWRARGLHG